MTRRRIALPVALVSFALMAVVAAGPATGGSNGAGAAPLGPGEVTVTLTIRHSHFDPERVSVRPGTTVRFVVRNTDPIGHELIVGDAEVHRRHETGTEAVHPPRPGEVSVPAQATAETTFRFGAPSDEPVVYACHLPGHLAYGMSGEVNIVAS